MGRSKNGRRTRQPGQTGLRWFRSRRESRGKARSGAAVRLTDNTTDDNTRAPWLKAGGPVVRFILLFIVLIGVFYAIYIPWSQTGVYHLYLRSIAKAVYAVLHVLGFDAEVNGVFVSIPGFGIKIGPGCDAMEAIGLFGSAVLAFPAARWARLTFACIGTAGILVINVVRLGTLVLVGAYSREAFDIIHWDLWPALLILYVLAFWVVWIRWTSRHRGPASDVTQ